MNVFSYIVTRLIIDLIKNEPVNIGVVINDNKSETSYGKFIDLDQIKKKVGNFNVTMINHILKQLEGKKSFTHDFEKLSKIFTENLQFTSHRAIKNESIEGAMDNIFNQYISFDKTIPTHRKLDNALEKELQKNN